jgi:hypothetical protein
MRTLRAERYVVMAFLGVLLLSACTPAGVGAPDPATEPPVTPHPDASREPNGLDTDLRVSTRNWETDFTRHDVNLSEIVGGGPGKDGIPSIDNPRFLPVDEVDWLDDPEPVIALTIDGVSRAYPIQILMWHEIVNDEVAGRPVTVTFCPLCHTGIVFDRQVDGRVLDFGTTGNLRHSDLVMYDRETESWWQQATGRAIMGELTGTALEFLPSQLISWEQFRTAHPDGEVLSRETGHLRNYGQNPYVGYDRADTTPFLLQDETLIDGRLSPKVRVLALTIDDDAVAYPFPFLAEESVVNDEAGDQPLVVLWAPGVASGLGEPTVAGGEDVGAANAFSRSIDGQTLTFEPASAAGTMRDVETGSTWDFSGRATGGELEGRELQLLVFDAPFWFAWAIFNPDTRIWQPE